MAKGNDIDLDEISMKKRKCEKKRVNKRKTKIIMGGQNTPYILLSVLGVVIETIAIMAIYSLVIEKKYKEQ